jgi:hypothetical protein
VRTPRGERQFVVERTQAHLSYALLNGILARRRRARKREWILMAPHVPAAMGAYLTRQGANYVDAAGNCALRVGPTYVASIQGRPPESREPRGRGIGVPGYRVMFAILARPEHLDAPVRALARASGAGKTTAAQVLSRLEAEGFVARGEEHRHLVRQQALLDRWLAGYAASVRPRLLLGRFRTPEADPEALEARIERALAGTKGWAWGGGAAAMRLTGHSRGEETVLHLARAAPDLRLRLEALPDSGGRLVVVLAPGPAAPEGVVERTAHPLLVYTELLAAPDPRARETAQMIRERYLAWIR